MKTLGIVDWDDIKVGEVFAGRGGGCWNIGVKTNNNSFFFIESGDEPYWYRFQCVFASAKDRCRYWFATGGLHKLPISFQRNWIGYGK